MKKANSVPFFRAQDDREQALQDLKDGTVKVLIATGRARKLSVTKAWMSAEWLQ
jgi:hypothetical protein